jgi:hypothetical protein
MNGNILLQETESKDGIWLYMNAHRHVPIYLPYSVLSTWDSAAAALRCGQDPDDSRLTIGKVFSGCVTQVEGRVKSSVFELGVDDIDGWEIPLLVCVAGPRYHTKRLPGAIGRHRGSFHIDLPHPLIRIQLDLVNE